LVQIEFFSFPKFEYFDALHIQITTLRTMQLCQQVLSNGLAEYAFF